MQYVEGADQDATGCVFCELLAEDDDDRTNILWRGRDVFAILNAFPYNTGHLMIAPVQHLPGLQDITPAVRAEVMEVTTAAIEIITEAMSPQGFNAGMNLGAVAGAGIPGHLHMHVVPRWGGDTNYLTTIGDTKVLPEMLAETAAKLRPGFARLQL
ncbi:MAG: HIT family protein [Actinomycetota bacterium]